jgi:hypothetical protein
MYLAIIISPKTVAIDQSAAARLLEISKRVHKVQAQRTEK